MNKNNSVLLTGASGYIGAHLASSLSEDGYDVHLLLRSTSNFRFLEERLRSLPIWYYSSFKDIFEPFSQVKFNCVFHLAGTSENEGQIEAVERLINGNFVLGTHVLKASIISGCECFINTGSYWQVDSQGNVKPNSLYADFKEAFQTVLSGCGARSGLNYLTLMLHDVYGDNDTRGKIIDLMIDSAIVGKRLELTPGKQILDFVNVNDVVSAYRTAWNYILETRPMSKKYFIRNERVSLIEVADKIDRILSTKTDWVWGAKSYRENVIMDPFQGALLPDWTPVVTLDNWLPMTIERRTRNRG